MKTNLFIIGAAKCATTSFHDYLNQHPEINMSSIKEPNYFSNEEIEDDNLYYLGANSFSSIEKYEKLFDKSKGYKFYGESSVSYISYSKTAKKIYDYNPDSKILIFLRNPVDRAFSHYLMDYSAGYFNFNITDIIENENIPIPIYQQIIELGFYSNQISRYIDLFGRDQVKILFFEECIKDLDFAMNTVEEFLDIPSYKNYNFSIENSYSSSDIPLIKSAYRNVKFKYFLKLILPYKLIKSIKNKLLSSKKPALEELHRKRLLEVYKGDIIELEKVTKKNLKEIWAL